MGFFDRFRGFGARREVRPLRDWFQVTFDESRIYISAEPPGRDSWSQDFPWASIERICFKAEGPYASDGIYLFTSERPESYVIPTEADGGTKLWEEVLRRGLFDSELAIEAASSVAGMFTWPPESSGSGAA